MVAVAAGAVIYKRLAGRTTLDDGQAWEEFFIAFCIQENGSRWRDCAPYWKLEGELDTRWCIMVVCYFPSVFMQEIGI